MSSEEAVAVSKRPTWKIRLDEALHNFEDSVLGFGGMTRDIIFLIVSAIGLLDQSNVWK